jgi:trans-AT polyketide synthase, acyltransferase and oxidoreductase domains
MAFGKIDDFQVETFEVIWSDRVERGEGAGGGLAKQLERIGLKPIISMFVGDPKLQKVCLSDKGTLISFCREEDGLEMSVTWPSGESYKESISLPRSATSGAEDISTVGFVPVEDSRIGDDLALAAVVNDPSKSLYVTEGATGLNFYTDGSISAGKGAVKLVAELPSSLPLGPKWLREALGVNHCYFGGAMAGGIASEEHVMALSKAGFLGFFGSGGLPIARVEAALKKVSTALDGVGPWGFNLLHNPVEPKMEEETVDLYLKYNVRIVSAAAFMGLTRAVVRYRYSGASQDAEGNCHVVNRVFAKVSRPEVATHFCKPAPAKIVDELVASGGLTADEGKVARLIPMADGITCEGDSGGHTDHRPLTVILPVIRRLRDEIASENPSGWRVAIGAAGGIGTPSALAGAVQMGADYVLTGSINQATPEAGTSELAKNMLLSAGMADVGSGAAPDMFEIGAHVQVLSRGSMYAMRSNRLYAAYKSYGGWGEIPDKERVRLEKILGRPFDEIWAECDSYWSGRDIAQVERAERDPRHKMALVFRWYLGMASRWARLGEVSRKKDYQIWCGPAMGGFNDWVKGSYLEPLQARGVAVIAKELIRGAMAVERANTLRRLGIELPKKAGYYRPEPV